MQEVVIKVRDLHKDFRLTHSGVGSLKTLLLWWKRSYVEDFHVLKGLTFDIRAGESVAIIGRNGAGKSTLLSILSRIYKATSGTAEVTGRIAPLLELGAGFHPDLTGLQNIFINASILGLSKKQIEERVDAIVEFSELINHIDAPVRTYSSGMAARLGFAVAVHVDAEILLIDEVLSVGDFAFKEKCADKMRQFREAGKTILLVSHTTADLHRLASRCMWLQNGQIEMDGAPEVVLPEYLKRSTNTFDMPIE